jgi:hypothetical protein
VFERSSCAFTTNQQETKCTDPLIGCDGHGLTEKLGGDSPAVDVQQHFPGELPFRHHRLSKVFPVFVALKKSHQCCDLAAHARPFYWHVCATGSHYSVNLAYLGT